MCLFEKTSVQESGLLQRSTGARIPDKLGITPQPALERTGRPRLQLRSALLNCGLVKSDIQSPSRNVNIDHIPILKEPNHPALGRFRRDVSNTSTMGGPGETSIRNQGDLFAKPRANDVGRRREHLLHTRTALWSFVANDHDIARFNLTSQNPIASFFL